MKENRLSIIIPFYNKKDTILRSVNSVIGQTYTNWELIIIDDCGEEKIDINILPQDERITVLFNESNLGAAQTRQRGLDNAKGEYIAFLDADDWWGEQILDSCLEVLINVKNADGAYVQTFIINNDGSQNLRRYCDRGYSSIRETLIQYARPWQTGGVLWRRKSCGNWGNLRTHEDSWFEFTSTQTNLLLPVFNSCYYVDMTGDNHLSKTNHLANTTRDQQELFLMVEKNFWKKLSLKYKIVLIHRLLRGQLKILEYCPKSDGAFYRKKLLKQQYFIGLISNYQFVLKVIHKVLQNSPYKIYH